MLGPAVPSLMREMNERRVFDETLASGRVSCSQLSGRTGISKPTVTSVIRSLAAAGFVRPGGRSSGQPGRSGLLYSVAADGGYVVAVDIGVRAVRVAIGDLTGAMVTQAEVVSPGDDVGAIADVVAVLIRACLRRVKVAKGSVMASVVGSPGAVDPRQRGLTHAGRLTCLEGVDLASVLSDRTGLPMVVENDVNLAALGEQTWGESDANMVVLSVGVGVGAALIMDGRLFRGPRGAAGEIEAVPFGGATRKCPPLLPASRVQLIRYVALRVSALAAITDAALVVLTGDVGLDRSLLTPVRRLVAGHLSEPPRIEVSALGDSAVLLGGLASAHAAGLDRVFSNRLRRPRSA